MLYLLSLYPQLAGHILPLPEPSFGPESKWRLVVSGERVWWIELIVGDSDDPLAIGRNPAAPRANNRTSKYLAPFLILNTPSYIDRTTYTE